MGFCGSEEATVLYGWNMNYPPLAELGHRRKLMIGGMAWKVIPGSG